MINTLFNSNKDNATNFLVKDVENRKIETTNIFLLKMSSATSSNACNQNKVLVDEIHHPQFNVGVLELYSKSFEDIFKIALTWIKLETA